MRLSESSLPNAKAELIGLNYDRSQVNIGIVHLGPGAFHRAHQAVYTDEVLRGGNLDWGICEVSIHSAGVRDALKPQDNLYTLAILDRELSYRAIGAIQEVLVAPEAPEKVVQRMADEATKVVTMTITEKGYCLTVDGGLDFSHESIIHDLANVAAPKSAVGFIVAALKARWQAGVKPFVVISCDNLTDNGHRLRRAVLEFAARIDAGFSAWIDAEVKFPCTMVDSITPATDDAVRAVVAEATDLDDAWPIQRESFSQWVIEDIDGVELPPWRDVGVTFSNNVQGYEATKLRILNGMHSSLAFVGILSGLTTVEEATKNPSLRAFIENVLHEEIIPTLPKVDGLDCRDYGRQILARFENPAIRHLLAQIAWDSSQKIPFRILGTIADNLSAERASPRLCFAMAAWMAFICHKVDIASDIVDPLAGQLKATAESCSGNAEDVDAFLAITQIFPANLTADARFVDAVKSAYVQLLERRESSLIDWLKDAEF